MSGTDLRIQKTYSALIREFTELLRVKSFEEITVKELCDNAMVRTATFYNHFSDKYEFADYIIRDALRRHHPDPGNYSDLKGPVFYEHFISDAFSLLEGNTELIRSLASDSMLWSISEVVRNTVHDELLEHIKSDKASGYDLACDPEILTEFIIGALEQT